MKKLLLIASFLSSFVSIAQTGYKATRNNGVNQTTEDYVINSPGNTPSNSFTTARYKDSTYVQWLFANAYFANLPNTVNNGNPINFLHTDGMGRVLSSSVSWLYPDTLNVFATKWYAGSNYYNKAQSDMRYLQHFTVDSQMVVDAVGPNVWSYLLNKSYHLLIDTPNLSIYALNSSLANYWLKNDTIGSNYTTQYRLDTAKSNLRGSISSVSGSLSGYLLKSDSGIYQTKYRSDTERTNVYASITTKFNTPSGTTAQYVRGDGSLATFPTIPAQVNITGGQNISKTGTYPNIVIADSFTTRVYTSGGLISQNMKVWCDTLTPSVSNNFSINISSAGFTRILSANVVAIRNTTTAATVPNAAIKTISTTAITCNIVEDNPATVSILGISVLSGLPSIFANVSGLQLAVTVIGY